MNEKYGVEDRIKLIKDELEEVRKKMSEKTASEKALDDDMDRLEKRERDLLDELTSNLA